jgi:uncharacterized RDD family membrane protein YckC
MVEHRILTTENVPFTYQVAGIGTRLLAWLLDQLVLLTLAVAGAMLALAVWAITRRYGIAAAVFFTWLLVHRPLYCILLEWLWFGQTLGKRAIGIRVIHMQGTALTLWGSTVRNLLRFGDMLPGIIVGFPSYGLGAGIALGNPLNRRLGDLAAGTLVVRDARQQLSFHLVQAARMGTARAEVSLVPERLKVLTKEQKQTLIDLCLRRDQLRLLDRTRIFATAAAYLRERLQVTAGEQESDERLVLSVAAALTQQTRAVA